MNLKNACKYITELINIIENPEKVSKDYKTYLISSAKEFIKKQITTKP